MLEIHVWGSTIDDVEHCNRLVFDLDPGDDVKWADVNKAARELRERLAGIKLKSFVKTTGGKGLHVVVPTDGTPWDETKDFSHAMVLAMAADAPDRYVAKMTKSIRTGKIFLDYLRNGRGATAIVAYSTRARPGAAVSTPVAWDELGPKLAPNKFTVLNIGKRLGALKTRPVGRDRQGEAEAAEASDDDASQAFRLGDRPAVKCRRYRRRAAMALTLYELGGLDDRRYSLYSWRARMALAHKGLTPEYRPVHVSDKAAIAFSKQDKVPILVDGETVIQDSFRIAQHLEAHHGGAEPVRRRDRTGARALLQFMGRPHAGAAPRAADRASTCRASSTRPTGAHLRGVMEKAFGKTLEELAANRDKDVVGFRRLLDPARASLRVAAVHLRRAAGLSRTTSCSACSSGRAS